MSDHKDQDDLTVAYMAGSASRLDELRAKDAEIAELRQSLDAWIKRCVGAEQDRDLLADWKRRNLEWEDERAALLHEVRELRSGAPLQEIAALRAQIAELSELNDRNVAWREVESLRKERTGLEAERDSANEEIAALRSELEIAINARNRIQMETRRSCMSALRLIQIERDEARELATSQEIRWRELERGAVQRLAELAREKAAEVDLRNSAIKEIERTISERDAALSTVQEARGLLEQARPCVHYAMMSPVGEMAKILGAIDAFLTRTAPKEQS